jgi:hypothetical protein
MLSEANQITLKTHTKLACELCDFKCSKKSDWDRHILTQKHINANKMLENANSFTSENAIPITFICKNCNKEFIHSSSLSRHKKRCQQNQENKQLFDESQITPELIMSVLQQNKELQQILIQQNKTIIELSKNNNTITNNTITNSNSNNKTFNLNVFLNETCKDAMNINDFVDSLKLQLTDLEKFGKIGFVEGISNIIIKNLNSLDETMRPVHCTDSKREVMYVKDENKWEKENENKQKLRKAIKQIAHKNSKLLNEFKQKHPNCEKSDSKFSDQYNKLVIEALGGRGDNDIEKEDKIIRNIAKKVTIEKSLI